jgi:hypothetical protein
MRDMTRELLIRTSRPMHMTRTRESSALRPSTFAFHAFSRSSLPMFPRDLPRMVPHPSLTFLHGTKNFPPNRPHLTQGIARFLDAIKFEISPRLFSAYREV